MIIEIEDCMGTTIGATYVKEPENMNDIKIKNCIGDISIADIDFDGIFNTNDLKIRIQITDEHSLNDNVKKANEIVDDIVSVRGGQGLLYDEEILNMFVNEYYEEEKEKVRELVDEMMIENHVNENTLEIL